MNYPILVRIKPRGSGALQLPSRFLILLELEELTCEFLSGIPLMPCMANLMWIEELRKPEGQGFMGGCSLSQSNMSRVWELVLFKHFESARAS
jgi:hypothetical protein